MEFSGQEYWNGLPLPTPGDFPDPGIVSCVSCISRWILHQLRHLREGVIWTNVHSFESLWTILIKCNITNFHRKWTTTLPVPPSVPSNSVLPLLSKHNLKKAIGNSDIRSNPSPPNPWEKTALKHDSDSSALLKFYIAFFLNWRLF